MVSIWSSTTAKAIYAGVTLPAAVPPAGSTYGSVAT